MQDLGNTQYFRVQTEPETGVKVVLSTVYEALTEKGYNPVNQIVGYIMSGDPTYITSYKSARSLIMKVERDEILEELMENGYVAGRPAIGISGEQLPAAARVYYGLPEGVYVTYVAPDSGAWEAGVRKGDIITAISGTAVSSVDALNTVKNRYSAGDTITLTIYRSGQTADVDITLMDEALQTEQ